MTDSNESISTRRNNKEKILEAAIELFSEKGFSGISVRDITKKVGIRESSLYNHFRSKDEILEVIIEKFRLEFGTVIFDESTIEEAVSTMEPETFFQHHLIGLRQKITPIMQMIWKIIYMEQFRDKRARDFVINEIIDRPAAFYEKAFRIMAEKGHIKPIDPKLLSDELNYSLMAISMERMLLQTDNEDITMTVKKMFAHIKFICDVIKK